jgi:hypothetical protein
VQRSDNTKKHELVLPWVTNLKSATFTSIWPGAPSMNEAAIIFRNCSTCELLAVSKLRNWNAVPALASAAPNKLLWAFLLFLHEFNSTKLKDFPPVEPGSGERSYPGVLRVGGYR